ncbi:DUF1028 domain-containing protein [Microbacterium schleiferi]|uniref:DUF1028 domain-containing protein n=1 Tax=Microbacterium schleiferi TaxID=69362 RepID=UPI00311E47C3
MTYTALIRDTTAGTIGAATASCSLACGNAVILVDPRVGAVASQAWTNPSLRAKMLSAMSAGASAADAVARVPEWDEGFPWRQVAALGHSGAGAALTGSDVSSWAGHRIGADAVIAGNLLTGKGVLEAMATADEDDRSDARKAGDARLAYRLLAMLEAGERAGGDARGRQSAAIVVGRIGGEVTYDLRVDDAEDPLRELRRLIDLRAAERGVEAAPLSARTE